MSSRRTPLSPMGSHEGNKSLEGPGQKPGRKFKFPVKRARDAMKAGGQPRNDFERAWLKRRQDREARDHWEPESSRQDERSRRRSRSPYESTSGRYSGSRRRSQSPHSGSHYDASKGSRGDSYRSRDDSNRRDSYRGVAEVLAIVRGSGFATGAGPDRFPETVTGTGRGQTPDLADLASIRRQTIAAGQIPLVA
ncbi:hypothetical protein BU24DRAFT_41887 [Aaosphaeria arxii CBS 175.79]|uniref:Uncharacterized protein n=1 Tax=Aaosphaeria arxii CBS 175.79 TaxID=1450172 RepID=A0A6A5Y9L9_9PLEO|nr:uncharacterized protein BU24DRAFT_41887 [Aaosphaeria arxii CBS 175.79]KAF2022285.1 hypothetical protein BU24DRAFT_41887 [Aaosphaeria arxii CBS 175.79]